MIIPMQRAQLQRPSRIAVRPLLPQPTAMPIDRQLGQLANAAAAATRGLLVLFGGLALWRQTPPATLVGALYAALALAGLMIGLSLVQRPPFSIALVADSLTAGLLLLGTGGAGSPLLGLLLLLSVQGGVLGGGRDALAGSGAGIVVFLLLNCVSGPMPAGPAAAVIGAQLLFGAATAWVCDRAGAMLTALSTDAASREGRAGGQADRIMATWWRHGQQINECATLEDLTRLVTQAATSIADAATSVELPGARVPDRAVGASAQGRSVEAGGGHGRGPSVAGDARIVRIPIVGPGSAGCLAVYRAPDELDPLVRAALEHLALLAAARTAALRCADQLRRQQEALLALWQIAGVLRAAPDLQRALRESAGQLAAVLDLRWLAVLAPDERRGLALVLLARGRCGEEAPRLNGAQLRVAAEALRGERPLVRSEGAETLACLPIRLKDGTSLVLVARGAAQDAATQALLMLFGTMIIDRLEADTLVHTLAHLA
jgi:hypothetical protein